MVSERPKNSSKNDNMDEPKKKSGKLSTEKPDEKSADLEISAEEQAKKKPRKKSAKKKKEQESATEVSAEKPIEKGPDEKAEKSKEKDGDEARLKIEADKQKEIRRKEFIGKYEALIRKQVEGGSREERIRSVAIHNGLDAEKIRNKIQENEELEKKTPNSTRAKNLEELRQALELVEREIENPSDDLDKTEVKVGGAGEITGAGDNSVESTGTSGDGKEASPVLTPQEIFTKALNEHAQKENLDIGQKSMLYARAYTLDFDLDEIESEANYLARKNEIGELAEDDKQKMESLLTLAKVMKEAGMSKVAGGENQEQKSIQEAPAVIPAEEFENKKKDFLQKYDELEKNLLANPEDENLKKEKRARHFAMQFGFDADKIKNELADREKENEEKLGSVRPEYLEQLKMAVTLTETEIGNPPAQEPGPQTIERGETGNEEKITRLQKEVEELFNQMTREGITDEEKDDLSDKIAGKQGEMAALQGKSLDTPPEQDAETGKELMVIRDRVIAEMAQGKSLAERQTELEGMSARNPREQAELDYIIRGGRINAIIQVFANVEKKDNKEYWEKYGASFFEGYEQALKDATAGGAKEPDAEKFGTKLLEYLPDEGNPNMAELKKGGGEALKKITDAIGEIFKEKDPAKQEEKSGESKELKQMKEIMGEDGFKEFMKTLLEAKERKEKGEITSEEVAKQKEKLEKAKAGIGGFMEKAWSIAGLVGIMLLLGLIFMIIVELEAIDFMLKKSKGGKGGIF